MKVSSNEIHTTLSSPKSETVYLVHVTIATMHYRILVVVELQETRQLDMYQVVLKSWQACSMSRSMPAMIKCRVLWNKSYLPVAYNYAI